MHRLVVAEIGDGAVMIAGVAAARRGLVPVVVAMGFGSDGPYGGLQAFDDLIQGASGACDLLPYYDGDPALRPIPSIVADKTCGLFAVIATQAALVWHYKRNGWDEKGVPTAETLKELAIYVHSLGGGR